MVQTSFQTENKKRKSKIFNDFSRKAGGFVILLMGYVLLCCSRDVYMFVECILRSGCLAFPAESFSRENLLMFSVSCFSP